MMNFSNHFDERNTMRLAPWIGLASLINLSLASGPIARGDYTYQYVFSQPSFTVAPTGTVLVSVSLQERVTGGSASRLATDGLFSAGVRLMFGSSSPTAAQVVAPTDITFNSAFNSTFQTRTVNAGVSAELTESVDFASPVVLGSALGGGVYQVFLGSFRFTAGSVAGQTTSITAADIPSTTDTLTGAGFILDALIQPASATIATTSNVVTVPEPASLILLGLAGACFRPIRRWVASSEGSAG